MKTKNRKDKRGLVLIAASLVILVVVLAVQPKKQQPEHRATTSKREVVWKVGPAVEVAYPCGTATNDIVGDTLADLGKLYNYLTNKAPADTNLLRLIHQEMSMAITPTQFDADLKKLAGKELGFIGQYHESLDMGDTPIESIQEHILQLIRDGHYEVMWNEDFVGGEVITTQVGVDQKVVESLECDVPEIHNFTNRTEIMDYFVRSVPLHVSFRLILDPTSKIEVRGADYHPVKAIQQHLMAYNVPWMRHPAHTATFTKEEFAGMINVLSSVRNLYILHTIAQKADWNKKNVLVLGEAHTAHFAYLMARYGIKCTPVYPVYN